MREIKKPVISIYRSEETRDTNAKFVIEPLEKGFGVTLGNTLRRVLLSALPGTAATTIMIDGVVHEFGAIPGVIEDITEIIANIKGIVFRLHCDEPQTVKIEKSGEGPVTADDILTTEDVEVINPDHVIAHLVSNGKINMEITVEKGRGFVLAADHEMNRERELNRIMIDSLFTPVREVNYKVFDTRVGHDTNYDRLEIDIRTNGSIVPDEAVTYATRFFMEYLKLFIRAEDIKSEVMVEEQEKVENKSNQDILIKDLEFSVRARNCLKRGNIKNLGDLVKFRAHELISLRNFGKKSLVEIREKLGQYGLALKGEDPQIGKIDIDDEDDEE